MRLSRLLLIVLVLALGWWLLTRTGVLSTRSGGDSTTAPVDRAQAAREARDALNAEIAAYLRGVMDERARWQEGERARGVDMAVNQ